MKRIRLRGWFVLALVGAVLALGCPQGADRPATYQVTGKVTQNGSPVEGATVTFAPTGAGSAAVGKTDASGQYALSTSGDEGALPGQYNVTVVKYEGQADVGAGGEIDMDSEAYEKIQAGGGASAQQAEAKNLLPEKYANPADSGFKATVTEDESKNVFDFNLEG